jgi:predicted nuclease of predicted toxin-antitoxin system
MPDAQVLSQATAGHIVMIEDKDFGELVFRERWPAQGVVLVRLEGISMERRAALVAAALADVGDRLMGSFTVISHGGTRRQPIPRIFRRQEAE